MSLVKRTVFGHKLNAKAPFKGINGIPKFTATPGQAVYPIMDLIKYDNMILDPGAEGDCTAAASGGVWMYLQLYKWRLANPGYTALDFEAQVSMQKKVSMDFIYALELTHDGDFGQDNGSFGSTAAWVLANLGVVTEDVWPNTGEGYFEYPSTVALQSALPNVVSPFQLMDLEDVRTSISEGYPAWIGCPVFPSFVNSVAVMRSGLIPMPGSGEQPAGGHEMKVIGHNDSDRMLLIDNSWGTQVGVGGRFYMPYDYFEAYVSEAYTARLK